MTLKKRPKPPFNFLNVKDKNSYSLSWLHKYETFLDSLTQKLRDLLEEHEQIESAVARALNAELIVKWILEALE